MALGEQAEQRLARDLRYRIPHRHVDGADRDGALAVATRLLVGHHRAPDLVRVEIVAGSVQQRFRIGLQDARGKALADQAALAVAAVGVKAVADDALAVAHDVGDDGNEARRHLGEIDIGVADRRRDRLRDLADVDDADGHVVGLSLSSLRGALATKQSRLPSRKDPGLLRFARNDGGESARTDEERALAMTRRERALTSYP